MSHGESPEKLVAMANQIGVFFASQRRRDSAQAVAEHLRKFWTPSMRAQIRAHVDDGGAGLSDVAIRAVNLIDHPSRPIPVGADDDSSDHAHPAGA
jgi:formate dehydrogenase subunit delta